MKKVLILLFTLVSLIGMIAYGEDQNNFIDVENHWAEKYINYMVENGFSGGYPDGTFKPENNIRVDEFITLCVKAVPITEVTSSLDDEYWATPFIEKAKELKILNAADYFKFKEDITREEMAVLAIRTFKIINPDVDLTVNSEVFSLINDLSALTLEYQYDVIQSYTIGLLTGKPENKFDPKGNVTRAESAVVIMKMKESSERKPVELVDVPFTMTEYTEFTDLGWQDVPLKFYAPAGLNGIRMVDMIEIYEHFEAIKGQQENGYIEIGYNPYSKRLGIQFLKEYKNNMSLEETLNMTDFSFTLDFGNIVYRELKYELLYWNRNIKYDELSSRHGDHLDYIYQYFFEDEMEFMKSEIIKNFNKGPLTYEGRIEEYYVLKNKRNIRLGAIRDFGLSISNKKTDEEK